MARRRRKVNTDTLDAKIEQQKAALEKAKARYEAEKETLAELIKLRNEMRKEELMEAVIKSDRSYANTAEPIEKQRKVHSYGIWLNCHIRWNANRKTGKEFSWSVT